MPVEHNARVAAERFLASKGIAYTINDDHTITAHGAILIQKSDLVERDGEPALPDLSMVRCEQSFNCGDLNLTSLRGAPLSVRGHCFCYGNRLRNLDGIPQTVGGNLSLSNSQLTSLKGAPSHVGGSFYCGGNWLESLEGAPKTVGDGFVCTGNRHLTSLKGAPRVVPGNFDCNNNHLITLEDGPESVGGRFDCSGNALTTLKGAPSVKQSFNCSANPLRNYKGIAAFGELVCDAGTFTPETFAEFVEGLSTIASGHRSRTSTTKPSRKHAR